MPPFLRPCKRAPSLLPSLFWYFLFFFSVLFSAEHLSALTYYVCLLFMCVLHNMWALREQEFIYFSSIAASLSQSSACGHIRSLINDIKNLISEWKKWMNKQHFELLESKFGLDTFGGRKERKCDGFKCYQSEERTPVIKEVQAHLPPGHSERTLFLVTVYESLLMT